MHQPATPAGPPQRHPIARPRPLRSSALSSLRARALARAVKGKALTQRQVAALLGITQPTVARAEARALAKIRRALDSPRYR